MIFNKLKQTKSIFHFNPKFIQINQMDSVKEIEALQSQATNKQGFIKVIIDNLRRQAKRILMTQARYNSQTKSDGIFIKINPAFCDFKQIQEYNDLISKQFCTKLQQISTKVKNVRIKAQKLSNDIKARPADDNSQKIQQIKDVLVNCDNQLLQIWKEEHFLVLNYKLDIVAKELERWTAVMESNKFEEQEALKSIDKLFR